MVFALLANLGGSSEKVFAWVFVETLQHLSAKNVTMGTLPRAMGASAVSFSVVLDALTVGSAIAMHVNLAGLWLMEDVRQSVETEWKWIQNGVMTETSLQRTDVISAIIYAQEGAHSACMANV